MTDPRYILEITDQYRQYGPWGIRVPSGGTIYFNTKEEAEKYMEEHPWESAPVCHACGYVEGICQYPNNQAEYPHAFTPKPIPPTSAPFKAGGYAAPTENADYIRGWNAAVSAAIGIATTTGPFTTIREIRALAKGESNG